MKSLEERVKSSLIKHNFKDTKVTSSEDRLVLTVPKSELKTSVGYIDPKMILPVLVETNTVCVKRERDWDNNTPVVFTIRKINKLEKTFYDWIEEYLPDDYKMSTRSDDSERDVDTDKVYITNSNFGLSGMMFLCTEENFKEHLNPENYDLIGYFMNIDNHEDDYDDDYDYDFEYSPFGCGSDTTWDCTVIEINNKWYFLTYCRD